MTDDQRLNLSAQLGEVSRTLKVLSSGSLTLDQRQNINAATGAISRTLSILTTGSLTTDQRANLTAALNNVSRTLNTSATGTLSADQKANINAVLGNVSRTLNATGTGSLTADQRAVIDAVSGSVSQKVEASVAFANSLSPDGGILAYNKADVASAYFHGGKFLSHWLSDIAAHTNQTVGWLEKVRDSITAGVFVKGNGNDGAVRVYSNLQSGANYFVQFAKGGAFNGGAQAFAKGGAFTNSVVSTPTPFNMGLMGEAGPEAIMPLRRDSSGQLGVIAQTNGMNMGEVLIELRQANQFAQTQIRLAQATAQQAMKDNAEMKAELQMLRKKASLGATQ